MESPWIFLWFKEQLEKESQQLVAWSDGSTASKGILLYSSKEIFYHYSSSSLSSTTMKLTRCSDLVVIDVSGEPDQDDGHQDQDDREEQQS